MNIKKFVDYFKIHYAAQLVIIFTIGTVLFSILIIGVKRLDGSDDTIFPLQISPYHNVIEWVNYRYHTWSGRLFAESLVYIFSPISLIYWKLVSIIMYAISSIYLFLMYRLWSGPKNYNKDWKIAVVIIFLPFLTGYETIFYATFWPTGGIFYFWMVTFALMAVYPILYYLINNKPPKWHFSLLGIIGSVVSSVSQEQIGFILLLLSIIALTMDVFMVYKTNKIIKINTYLLMFFILIIGSVVISLSAPGNKARLISEITTWIPNFNSISVLKKASYSYSWFLESFINHTGFLLAIIWGLIGLIFLKTKPYRKLYTLFSVFSITTSVILLGKGHESLRFWFSFYNKWGTDPSTQTIYYLFVVWGIILLAGTITPLVLYKYKGWGWSISALYIISCAVTAAVTLSPTMYASGWRTVFIPSYILSVILLLLISSFMDLYKNIANITLTIVVILAFSNYLLLFDKLILK